MEKINEFFTEHTYNVKAIKDKIINKNILLRSTDLIIQNCGKFTTNYAFDLYKFILGTNRLRDLTNHEYFDFWGHEHNVGQGLFGVMADDIIRMIQDSPTNNFDELLDYYSEHKDYYKEPAMCGTITGALRISYDGTMYDCHGSIYDNHIVKEQLNDTVFDWDRYYSAQHSAIVNLLTDSDEKIDNYIDFYVKTHDSSTTFFMWHNLVNQIYILALAGQASRDYLYDFNKLK